MCVLAGAMSSKSSKGSNWGLLVGAITAIAVVGFAVTKFWPTSSSNLSGFSSKDSDEVLIDSGSDSESESESEPDSNTSLKKSEPTGKNDESKSSAENDAKYVQALSLATKYHKGERFIQASECFTEAILLYPHASEKIRGGPITSLYNNRSASLEKSGPEHYDAALRDLELVLNADGKNLKARARRARIFEAQGKLQEALVEYTVHVSTEQEFQLGSGHPTEGAKAQELGKRVAMSNVVVALEKMRSGQHEQNLPNKTYCSLFMEMFPSTHQWKDKFQGISIETLIQKFNDAPQENNLEELIDVVICAISMESYEVAFKFLSKPANIALSEEPSAMNLLSLRARLQGMFKHLRRNLNGAYACYKESLSYYPDSTESLLLLAHSSTEIFGVADEAQRIFVRVLCNLVGENNDILLKFITNSSKGTVTEESLPVEQLGVQYIRERYDVERCIDIAYCFYHRACHWVVRDSKHEFRENAIPLAERDLLLSLAILEGIGNSKESCRVARMLYVCTLLKLISLLGQTKGLAGVAQTEDDIAKCKKFVELAMAIEPKHPQVIMLRGDVFAMEDRYDEAMAQIEGLIGAADSEDGIIFVMKANMLTHQGMKYLAEGQEQQNPALQDGLFQKAKEYLKEAGDLYEKALQVDANCVEALAQACQLKFLLWEFESAVAYAERAVPLARSAEELNDLESLRVQTITNLAVFKEMSRFRN
jgi:tetratricopeptide (TPR) repeat protein